MRAKFSNFTKILYHSGLPQRPARLGTSKIHRYASSENITSSQHDINVKTSLICDCDAYVLHGDCWWLRGHVTAFPLSNKVSSPYINDGVARFFLLLISLFFFTPSSPKSKQRPLSLYTVSLRLSLIKPIRKAPNILLHYLHLLRRHLETLLFAIFFTFPSF